MKLPLTELKSAQPGATFFVYDLAAGEVVKAHPFVKNVGFNRPYRFSPNGRFLLLGKGQNSDPRCCISSIQKAARRRR
ncbi:MAG: hypothetical protein M5U34_20955 [Chloroflexi bacterium]|nr:hypothetical protein [Chloroflexota bacterium]